MHNKLFLLITVSHITSQHWQCVQFEAKFMIFKVTKFPNLRYVH